MSRPALLIGYGLGIGMGMVILSVGGTASEPVRNEPPEPKTEQVEKKTEEPSRAPGSNTVTDPTNAYRGGSLYLPVERPKNPEPVIDGRGIPDAIEFRKPEPKPTGTSQRRVPPGAPKPTFNEMKRKPASKKKSKASKTSERRP